MPAQTIDVIRDRVTSICAGTPFSFVPTIDPFSFELQPDANVDQTCYVQADSGSVVSGSNFSETRVDQVRIWLARRQTATPSATYRTLLTDVQSLSAAVTRDGLTGGGDYAVVDGGRGYSIQHSDGQAFAVLRLTLPVDYEAQL